MTQQNQRRDERALQRRLAALERRLQKLETAPRAGNTSVSHGKFLIQDGAGGAQLLRAGYLGQDAASGEDVRGTAIHRPTGEYVMATWSGVSGDVGGFWALYDKAGNIVVSDDAVSGQGIGRPYLGAAAFAPTDGSKWPTVVSATWTTQWLGMLIKQQPQLQLYVWTQTDTGTSGDVRWTTGTDTVAQSVASGENTIRTLTGPVSGAHLDQLEISVDMRRTSGGGRMACWVMGAYGAAS